MQWGDPAQVVVCRIGADTLKEGTDLPGPFLEVGAENQRFLVVTKLGGGEFLDRRDAVTGRLRSDLGNLQDSGNDINERNGGH